MADIASPAIGRLDLEVKGLPRVDRYYPQCWVAIIEAVSHSLFKTGNFGKVYGRHAFQYVSPGTPLAFKGNGIELDLHFSRVPLEKNAMRTGIESIYGIRIQDLDFTDFVDFWTYCLESLQKGEPIICDFNMAFIKARREYRKVYSPHNIAVSGIAEGSRVKAIEQMLGSITIDFGDFREAFDHTVANSGKMQVFKLSASGRPERMLTYDEVIGRLEANLTNLESSDPRLGLGSLKSFRDDIEGYLKSRFPDTRPFAIPGLWVFSHERHIVRKWLRSLGGFEKLKYEQRFLGGFDSLLESLFRKWRNVDFLLEKSLISGKATGFDQLPSYFDAILEEEAKATEMWNRLKIVLVGQ